MDLMVDVHFDEAFRDLDGLKERAQSGLRQAAFEGARIVREEIRVQAPRSEKAHYFYSRGSKNADGSKRRYLFESGDLRRSIYAFYDKKLSTEGSEAVYQVGWRHNEGKKGKFEAGEYKAVPYGFMVHNGVERSEGASIAARPFLTNAWRISQQRAEASMIQTFKQVVADGKNVD